MKPEIADNIKAIKKDKVHGATWLSEQAVNILILTAEQSQAKPTDEFLGEIREVAQSLSRARPTMSSIANYTCRFLFEIISYSQLESDSSSLKAFARAKGEEIIESQRQAVLRVAKNGADIIQTSDILMTCSYSTTVCQCLTIAKKGGEDFSVIIAESMSAGGKLYGEMTAEQLRLSGISTEVIRDAEIPDYVSRANKVLVGADSILKDGSLINGMPTYLLAQAASIADVPFYSLCPTAKFDPGHSKSRNLRLEAGFDKVPPQLITGIITERGVIRPSQISAHIQEIEKYRQVA